MKSGDVFVKAAIFILCICLTGGCGKGGDGSEGALGLPSDPGYFQVILNGGALSGAKSVFVNILSVEVFVQKENSPFIVVLANDVGLVDLLKLQNGMLQLLGNLTLPPDLGISQIRLILGSGNDVIMNDGSVCPLAAPSPQQSAINLPLTKSLTTDPDVAYSMTLDFEPAQSVTIQNGTCTFSPMVTVAYATQVQVVPPHMSSGQPLPSTWTADGSPTALSCSGLSNGSFTLNTTPGDPPTVSSANLW